MDSFNANFKKQRESTANQISNETKNTNHNLEKEGLINLRILYVTPLLVILILIVREIKELI